MAEAATLVLFVVILLATFVVPMRTDYVEALGKLKKGHVALFQAKPAPSCLLSSSPSASCRSCPFLAPQVTVRRTWQSDKLRFTRAANPPAGLQAGPGVWDADVLIALGQLLRYKRKHRTETAIMGDVVDLKGLPTHLENDLEFIAEAEMARLMLRHGRLTDEARDYIARKYPQ